MQKEQKLSPAGLDQKLEILNRISTWVKELKKYERLSFFTGELPIPGDILNEDAIKVLQEVGTSEYEFDAACSGITIGDPRDRNLI